MGFQELLTNPFLTLLSYYIGMVVWVGVIYTMRDTLYYVKDIYYEYRYDRGSLNDIPENVQNLYKTIIRNIVLMFIANFIVSIFSGVLLIFLGLPLFLLVSLPLMLMLFSLMVLMGVFNNTTSRDVHRNKTLLG